MNKFTQILFLFLLFNLASSNYSYSQLILPELGTSHGNQRCNEYEDLLRSCGVGTTDLSDEALGPKPTDLPDPTQPGSTQPDPTQPGSTQIDPTQIDPVGSSSGGNIDNGAGTVINSFCRTEVENTFRQEVLIVQDRINSNTYPGAAFWTNYQISLTSCSLRLGF